MLKYKEHTLSELIAAKKAIKFDLTLPMLDDEKYKLEEELSRLIIIINIKKDSVNLTKVLKDLKNKTDLAQKALAIAKSDLSVKFHGIKTHDGIILYEGDTFYTIDANFVVLENTYYQEIYSRTNYIFAYKTNAQDQLHFLKKFKKGAKFRIIDYGKSGTRRFDKACMEYYNLSIDKEYVYNFDPEKTWTVKESGFYNNGLSVYVERLGNDNKIEWDILPIFDANIDFE